MSISYEQISRDPAIRTYIQRADESLIALGYTEHSFPHVARVASVARRILADLGYDPHLQEMAAIAGFLHDIGNVINRIEHAQSGAIMVFRILSQMDADPEDIATIITAIGNHDESTAFPVNAVAAALILADKTDVRASRVRNPRSIHFDIHDRVNYAVRQSDVSIDAQERSIRLSLSIDTNICPITDYFEIFLDRMILCRKAAEKLECTFQLLINGQQLM